jgi:hypothetical protein
VDWAVAIEGRTDPESVLLLFAERSEAVEVAQEMERHKRWSVCVRPFRPAQGPVRDSRLTR